MNEQSHDNKKSTKSAKNDSKMKLLEDFLTQGYDQVAG